MPEGVDEASMMPLRGHFYFEKGLFSPVDPEGFSVVYPNRPGSEKLDGFSI